MSLINNIGELSNVARVVAIRDNGLLLYVEFMNGYTAPIENTDDVQVDVGSIILVGKQTNYIQLAPPELWPKTDKVGVIKKKLDDFTIVEHLFEHHILPTHLAPHYEEGNTVEYNKTEGVLRVLADETIKPIVAMTDVREKSVVEMFRIDRSQNKVTFDDFGGLPHVVERARELIELSLVKKDKLDEIGAKPIKGVLFTGGPGTGKTMLARIIANSTDAEFYEISGPQIFSKWYGESELILRKLFEDAGKQKRAIIFFDEIDSVAGKREGGSHEASKRVVAQLLTLMDGFTSTNNVIVIAATNRPQDIDEALRRPGRFDWEIDFSLPSTDDRHQILLVSSRHLKTGENLAHEWVAQHTDGWTAAQLTAIWKEAAILAVKDNRAIILNDDYIGGFERVFSEIDQKKAKESMG